MTIIRVKHDKKNPYVMINRAALWDKNLSLQAVGLWARLLARPDDWEIYTSELAKSCDVSVETINKYITELTENGYAARAQIRNKDENGKYPNRFGTWEYWIFEAKKTPEEVSNILSETVLSGPIVSSSIEPALLNSEGERNIDKNIVCTSAPVAPKKKSVLEVVSKKHPEGHEISISLEEVFRQAVLQKKYWDTQEIAEAWKILSDYRGLVRDFIAFIDGTIKNIRNEKKGKAYSQHQEREEEQCQKAEKSISEPCKKTSSERVTVGQIFPECLEEERRLKNSTTGYNGRPIPVL